MHLKNFSLIRDEHNDIKLSPAYDLLSTKLLLPGDNEESALTINGKRRNLKRSDFNYLSGKFSLQEKTLNAVFKKFLEIVDE